MSNIGRKIKNLIFYIFLHSTFYILHSTSLYAAGLRTLMGEMQVDNVPIGSSVSLRGISGQAYRVINTSEEPFLVTADIVGPAGGYKIPEGYVPIPDLSWVKLSERSFRLAPGQEGVADIIFSLPDDQKLMGKNFICYLHSRTVPISKGVGLAVGVQSNIFIHVALDRLTMEQRKKMEAIRELLRFEVVPLQMEISEFPVGIPVEIKKVFKKSFKIVNINDVPFKIEVAPMLASETMLGIKLQEGTQEGQPGWVRLPSKIYEVQESSVLEIPLTVQIPKDARAKKFIFILKVTLLGYEVPFSNYCRLTLLPK